MMKTAGVGVVAVATLIFAGVVGAGVDTTKAVVRANVGTASCARAVSIGFIAPITGAAASVGSDQLHWAQFFVDRWNAGKANKPKLKLVQGDTQLDPAKASTVAQSFASNGSLMGVIGPAGSDEVQAVAPIFRKAGLAFASASATRVSLTNGSYRGYFFRDVPNDSVQGPTDAQFIVSKLGAASGTTVMVVDDQESYSTGLADIVGKSLAGKGVKVDRESVNQKDTDFSALVGKITSSTKAVFLPFQLATQAQLFAQQVRAQRKSTPIFGSDGTYDIKNFTAGNYVSFFAPDLTTIPGDKKILSAFLKLYPGATSPFGAPNYVLAQLYAQAAAKACRDGKINRNELRRLFAKASLKTSLLGHPIRFTANGDLANARFQVFKIVNGHYETVG